MRGRIGSTGGSIASASTPHCTCSTIPTTSPRRIARSIANRPARPSASRTRKRTRRAQYVSFPPAKRLAPNGASMEKATRKPQIPVRRQTTSGQPLTSRQKRELAALAAMPDDQIDTSDIPELPPDAWKDAVRGRFYRPLKQAVSMRLDADVVAWLKKRGKGYQTRANSILRQRMLDETRRA